MARKKQKQQPDLDKVIQDMDYKALLELAVQNRNKRYSFTFSDYLNKKKENDMPKTITGLTQLLLSFIKQQLGAENGASDTDASHADKCTMVSQLVQVVVDIGHISLQLNVSARCQVELATLLNGILKEVPNIMDSVRNSMAQYCEKLQATNNFENCELFMPSTLIYLLQRTLSKKPAKADVKRIYAFRKLIGPIIEAKESNRELIWDLFKQCSVKPVFLMCMEGQKVLGIALALDIDRVTEIHENICKHLPSANIKLAMGYGKVYFEAWSNSIKNGRQDIKNVLEITCLQDFILLAITTKHRPFLPLVRKLLAQFHCHKKETEVSKMLYCLYQPLLWRFLKNPDGQIRANATQLFLDIFPLEDPDVKVVATDLELNDQLLMIRDLLLDEFPIVRITTILGICVSMSVNWEVFPEEMLKTYFRIIVDDLSRDSSSAEVRCAVVKGVKCLLENPLTMRSLIHVLPKLTGLFHDVSENVRIAFCQLLLRVKGISAIKYFQIVPIKHLFARLEEDCHSVKKSVTNLLCNSYFPRQEDPKVWMGRCLEIIKNERAAARVFFSYVSSFIGLESSIRFVVQVIKAVHFYVKTKQSCGQFELSNKENILNYNEYVTSLEEAVGFSNMNVVSSVMDSITALWLSLKSQLEKPENKIYLKMLVTKIGKPLADLCLYYKDTEAWESVFYLSSFLPPAIVPSLASLCFWKLKSLPSDAQPRDYMTLLECLCNQHQGLELLQLLKEWIEIGLTDSYVPPPAKKKRRSKSKKEAVTQDQPKPYLANKMLNSMLNHRGLQRALLMHDKVLKEMLFFIDHIKRKLERFNARLITETEASFLSLLMYNILRISVYLHNEDSDGSIQFIDEVVEWADQKLVRHLAFSIDNTDNFTNLISVLCKYLCHIIADVTLLGFYDPNSHIYLSFLEKLLRSGLGNKYAAIIGRSLYKHAASAQYVYLMENDALMLRHLLQSLCKIFDCFSNEGLLESISNHDLKDVQFTFGSVMQIVHNHVALLSESASSAFKCVLKNILQGIVAKTTLLVNDMADDSFDDISYPKISAFFLSIMIQKPALLPTYMKFLNECYKSSNKDIPTWIAYWTIVSHILEIKTLYKGTLRECHALVQNLEKTIHEAYPRRKSSESSETLDSVPVQLFQKHCHGEFIKLKSRLFSKLCAARKNLS